VNDGRLLSLVVSDLALIDRLRLDLLDGLNVITGETGAGKSLLIDALGLVLGGRADSTLVRHGAEAARVEALFDRAPEPVIVVREVTAGGRSTGRLDDEPVTASRLADQVGPLVEIHGQHDQQRLLDERWQRDLLDAFGGHDELRAEMAAAVDRWRANQAVLAELSIEPRELERRLAIHEHEASEIAGARLRPGEAAEVRQRLAAAQHGETIARGSGAIRDAITSEGHGARDSTADAAREARQLAQLDERFGPIAERLSGLEAELDDVAAEVRSLVEDLEHDAVAIAAMEERLSLIYALERRYGDDEDAVIAYGDRAASEVQRLRGLDGERARRAAQEARLLATIAEVGVRLSVERGAAAERLSSAVGEALEPLGFPSSVFQVSLGRRPAEAAEAAVEVDGDALAFDSTGIDQVVFLLAPNPGEPARPLSRIASGGELSRVALAVKEVLAQADATPTLVFDEIDSGIGGRSADGVGRSLWTLARDHQVLCVTHLAQIAAHADAHFQISKHARDGRTITEVRRLDREGRIVELAHMLAGANGGPAALAGARELLDRAEGWQRELAPTG
jgi:DNA repair protein RecN (Recombination protein N)